MIDPIILGHHSIALGNSSMGVFIKLVEDARKRSNCRV